MECNLLGIWPLLLAIAMSKKILLDEPPAESQQVELTSRYHDCAVHSSDPTNKNLKWM